MVHISRTTDPLNEQMIITLVGDIDLSAVANVRSTFHEVINDGFYSVLVDLADVTFVDSAALGILIGLHRRCTEKGGACVLVNPRLEVSRILSLSGLDVLLNIAADTETAIAAANTLATTDSATNGAGASR